jgi:hypothetical protein
MSKRKPKPAAPAPANVVPAEVFKMKLALKHPIGIWRHMAWGRMAIGYGHTSVIGVLSEPLSSTFVWRTRCATGSFSREVQHA